jgi:hypothetical protein
MSFPKRRGAFDPLDLEVIERVYETALAQVAAREPLRDREEDAERERALRMLVFALATPGNVDFDTLSDRVLANMPGHPMPLQKPAESKAVTPEL